MFGKKVGFLNDFFGGKTPNLTDLVQTDRGPSGWGGARTVSIWCDLVKRGRSYANFSFLGLKNLHTLPRMKYSKSELRAETFRVHSNNHGATFVF